MSKPLKVGFIMDHINLIKRISKAEGITSEQWVHFTILERLRVLKSKYRLKEKLEDGQDKEIED